MDFKEISDSIEKTKRVHAKAVDATKNYKKAEAALLEVLQEVDRHKVFRSMSYPSLFVYTTQCLGLSESVAYSFISVARKSIEVPELKQEIAQGGLTLSNAKRIVSVVTKENKKEWIEKAKTLPQRALEKEIAKVLPQAASPERIRYVTENRIEVRVTVSEELMKRLKRIQDLESQRTRKAATLEDALEKMAEEYLYRHDPVKKSERAKIREQEREKVRSTITNVFDRKKQATAHNTRKPIPARIKHQITKRDGQQCTYTTSNGSRCTNRRWLDVHHLILVSQGGSNELGNLTTLCHAHHHVQHDFVYLGDKEKIGQVSLL